MNNFLPENYEYQKEDGNFMKFQDGENRIRVLSSAIVGYEDWDDEKNFYRTKTRGEQPLSSRSSKPNAKIKHFWAMVVYNYRSKRVQVLEITQATIFDGFNTLLKDPDWGRPFGYDIVITKTGEGMETKYAVTPKPHKEIDPTIAKKYSELKINLEALYQGEDPFKQL